MYSLYRKNFVVAVDSGIFDIKKTLLSII